MKDLQHLTAYPRILAQIRVLWGTQDCRDLLLSLLSDSRDGDRSGFAPPAAAEMLRLLRTHDERFPAFDDSQRHITHHYAFAPERTVVKESPAHEGVVLRWLARALVLALVLGAAFRYLR